MNPTETTTSQPREEVAVIIGMGGIGLAAAQRLGRNRRLIVGTRSITTLSTAVDQLREEGCQVDGHLVDIGDPAKIDKFARVASDAGSVHSVVLTSGVSPVTTPTATVLQIDLLGCAQTIAAFQNLVASGGSMVCVASMSGYLIPLLPPATRQHLATAPVEKLLDPPEMNLRTLEPGYAYAVAKQANQLRVAGAAAAWGARGARINTVSPGVVATPMGHAELAGPSGSGLRQRLAKAAQPRPATPDEIAAAIEFLSGPAASYITGTDLLVDGGCISAGNYGHVVK